MASTTPNQTAAEAYADAQCDIAAIITWLQDELEVHADRAHGNAKNWGYVGDIHHVRSKLKETLSAISGIEVSEIEESLAELNL